MAKEKNLDILTTHVVVRGDTPWDLARKYYGFGTKWPIIMEFNSKEKGKMKKTLVDGETIQIPKLPDPPEENPDSKNSRLVKVDIANLEGRKLLQQDISMLNGVSEEAAKVLKDQLKIISIFDLAMSHYFNVARALVDSGSPLEASFLQHGFIPGDSLRGDPKDMDLNGLKNADIDEMNFGDETTAAKLQEALNIKTIRDMALWPPFQNSRQILLSTFDPTRTTKLGEDPEAPADLVPSTGNYPTESVYYTSVFLNEVDGQDDSLTDLVEDGGVDLFSGENTTQSFSQPAKGGILTYKQSWYAQGVTLGQLLHSLALAPGESTRVAMVDWYRRTSDKTTESIKERDALSEITGQARSINEITSAVASEMQHGSSVTSSASKSKQKGASGGLGLLFQASGGSSSNKSLATSVSHSFGQRNMAAEMNQRVLSSTQQHATAERSRRATIVAESYQEEKETLTTRIVTNYNHMHALSVQYYEVVQVYRVKTEITQAERVLFVPMKPVDFGDERVLIRYKDILKEVALSDDVKVKIDDWSKNFSAEMTLASAAYRDITGGDLPIEASEQKAWLYNSPILTKIDFQSYRKIDRVRIIKRNNDESVFDLQKRESNWWEELDDVFKAPVKDRYFDGSLNLVKRISLDDVNEIRIDLDDSSTNNRQPIVINFQFSDGKKINDQIYSLPSSDSITILKIKRHAWYPELFQHFQENATYYSQAIWLSLDAYTLSLMLAGYKYGDKPLAGYIDPVPVAITGNYLGFRWSFGDSEEEKAQAREWEQNIMQNNRSVEVEIPLPSGGVFAEAVLGRFNSAEKLDISRFWNWQDSPIPFAAPEIAPLTAGGKADSSTLTPGQLSQPAISINAAPNLPNPTGMSDMMQAMTVSNMFRDMTGQAATAALAGQGLEAANQGANNAVQQSAENYRTYVNMVGDVAKEVIPLVATKGLSGASVSKAGAVANMAGKMDENETENNENKQSVLSSLMGGVSKFLKKK